MGERLDMFALLRKVRLMAPQGKRQGQEKGRKLTKAERKQELIDKPLRGTAYFLLQYFAIVQGANPFCWKSNDAVCDENNLAYSTFWDAKEELVAKGLIMRKRFENKAIIGKFIKKGVITILQEAAIDGWIAKPDNVRARHQRPFTDDEMQALEKTNVEMLPNETEDFAGETDEDVDALV